MTKIKKRERDSEINKDLDGERNKNETKEEARMKLRKTQIIGLRKYLECEVEKGRTD
jgi:hypothetical protein